jgi:hypothetical protein
MAKRAARLGGVACTLALFGTMASLTSSSADGSSPATVAPRPVVFSVEPLVSGGGGGELMPVLRPFWLAHS